MLYVKNYSNYTSHKNNEKLYQSVIESVIKAHLINFLLFEAFSFLSFFVLDAQPSYLCRTKGRQELINISEI